MSLMRRFRWKDENGVETEYDLGAKASNVVQDGTHRFVTDTEKAAWNAKQESGSDTKTNVITFTAAEARENIQSGETQGTIMGKIHKFFADLKTVAFSGNYTDLSNKPTIGTAASYAIANNDTTTAEGYVADARIVRMHGLEIDQLSSDLASFQTGVDTIYNGCTTYGATPTAKTPAAIVNAIKAIFNNRYNSGIAAAKNFTLSAKVSGIIYNSGGAIWSGFHHDIVITCKNGQLSYSTAEQSGGTEPITTKTTLGNVSVNFEV